jgi:predicted XRE-type DNA-binding protein
MNEHKRLEAAGWRFGSVQEFLGLTDEEAAYIEIKLKLAKHLRKKRRESHLGQTGLAKLVESSQSRVAKMEAADSSVSIDLIVRSLLALGASQRELAKAISA